MMNYGCEGLNVVISGGTSGIGLATAEKFLRDGANVYILGRSVLRGAMAVQKLMAKTERTAVYIPCDVTSVEDCRKAIVSIGGVIHILVNAAGVYVEQRLENVTEADISNIFDTNVSEYIGIAEKGVDTVNYAKKFKESYPNFEFLLFPIRGKQNANPT